MGALLGIAALQAHADSGRAQVESLFTQYSEATKQRGVDGSGQKFITLGDDNPKAYVAAWPQLSKKLLLAKGMDPAKVEIDLRGGTWVVVSSTPRETAVFWSNDRYSSQPPDDPRQIAGFYYLFETKLEPGEGWKIVVDSKSGKYAKGKSVDAVTWREYVSRGYKNKIDSIYGGESSARGERKSESQQVQTRQVCEALKKTCLAGCGDPSYWNGSRFVDRQSWSGCQSRCGSIACN